MSCFQTKHPIEFYFIYSIYEYLSGILHRVDVYRIYTYMNQFLNVIWNNISGYNSKE